MTSAEQCIDDIGMKSLGRKDATSDIGRHIRTSGRFDRLVILILSYNKTRVKDGMGLPDGPMVYHTHVSRKLRRDNESIAFPTRILRKLTIGLTTTI